MHDEDRLTGEQLGIDPGTQEEMAQAWRKYRHAMPAASEAERDLHREWAQLDADVRADMWETEAAERAMDVYGDAELENELAELADLYDDLMPDRETLIVAAMLNDPYAAESIGQIISGDMLTDVEYQTLFAQLAQTLDWPREPISQETIDYLSRLESPPGQAIELARDMLANHLRWQLIDRENQHLLTESTTPQQIDPALEIPQSYPVHVETVNVRIG